MWWFSQLYHHRPWKWLIALACAGLGAGVEFVQGWSGYRAYESADILANSFGVLEAWWVSSKWLVFLKLKTLMEDQHE